MWEAQITCSECEKTDLVHADLNPRAFSFECPEKGRQVDMPFRDPSRLVLEWHEVERCSPSSIPASNTEARGKFEI